jgi:dTDP-4-dehydrorhamnose reductase
LTGATGQVGGALSSPLADLGTVLAPRREEFDLSRPKVIAETLDHLKPDLIINPAAYTAVDRAEEESELAFRVNSDAPGEIANWAAHHDVPLIHFSTDYVFDGSGHTPWREVDEPAPLSAYGASKLAGEVAVRAAGGPRLIVRTSWVYSNSGNNFMLTIARLAGEREELRIVADQFGAPSSARVIADTVIKILGRDGDVLRRLPQEHDTVNIACSNETSWWGFAGAILTGLKKRNVCLQTERVIPIGTDQYLTKARRPRNCRLDQNRLNLVFGIAMPSWQESLETELEVLACTRFR